MRGIPAHSGDGLDFVPRVRPVAQSWFLRAFFGGWLRRHAAITDVRDVYALEGLLVELRNGWTPAAITELCAAHLAELRAILAPSRPPPRSKARCGPGSGSW